MQKPALLTIFRREGYYLHTYLNNKYLTQTIDVQYYPDNYGQAHRFFQLLIENVTNVLYRTKLLVTHL